MLVGLVRGRCFLVSAEALWRSPSNASSQSSMDRAIGEVMAHTLELVLSGLGRAASRVEVVTDTSSGTDTEDEGKTRLLLSHCDCSLERVDFVWVSERCN